MAESDSKRGNNLGPPVLSVFINLKIFYWVKVSFFKMIFSFFLNYAIFRFWP